MLDKIIVVTVVFCLYCFSSCAQTKVEEYNYLTKGYKIQLESGLDMKSDYVFRDFGEYRTTTRACNFKGLYRKKSNVLAGTLALFNDANGRKYYLCIPTSKSSSELFAEYKKSLSLLDGYGATIDYIYFLSQFYSNRVK